MRALRQAPKDERLAVRHAFRDVGEIVRVKAEELFQKYSSTSAAGYRVRVRQRGVSVEQSLRKTTGRRPDYGALQMRKALLPARADTREEIEAKFEEALDVVALKFNR
jgi:hypothetical protein